MDREWVEGVDNFRNSYLNEVPLLREENANLRVQLETSVSRIDALEQQLKELLESITGTRPNEHVPEPMSEPMPEHGHEQGHEHGHEPESEPKPMAIDMAEKVDGEVIHGDVVNNEAIM